MFTHACIKPGCGNRYEDNEPDHYYCPSCNEMRKAIALEVDKKMASIPREQPVSDLQAFEAEAKVVTTPNGRTVSFGRA